MKLVRRYLVLSQVSLASLLLICTVTVPAVAEKSGGVSNFGNHQSTIVPYIMSFVLCSVFLCLAAARLLTMSDQFRVGATLLLFIALLDLLVLISTFPRKIDWTYSVIHDDLGIALYSYEFALSVWFVVKTLQFRYVSVIFVLVESIGSLIGLLSIENVIHLLFLGQIIGAVGFGLLLPTAFPSVVTRDYVDHPS